jgi:hypothetical protein
MLLLIRCEGREKGLVRPVLALEKCLVITRYGNAQYFTIRLAVH